MHRKFFHLFAKALVSGVLPIYVAAQISLDAPLQDFTIPGFGEDGFPAWVLKGKELQYLNEKSAVVKNMNLQLLAGNGNRKVETDFFSPAAMFYLKESRAQGKELLKIQGKHFQITGREWQWDGKNRTVKIYKKVKVTFDEKLQIF